MYDLPKKQAVFARSLIAVTTIFL